MVALALCPESRKDRRSTHWRTKGLLMPALFTRSSNGPSSCVDWKAPGGARRSTQHPRQQSRRGHSARSAAVRQILGNGPRSCVTDAPGQPMPRPHQALCTREEGMQHAAQLFVAYHHPSQSFSSDAHTQSQCSQQSMDWQGPCPVLAATVPFFFDLQEAWHNPTRLMPQHARAPTQRYPEPCVWKCVF